MSMTALSPISSVSDPTDPLNRASNTGEKAASDDELPSSDAAFRFHLHKNRQAECLQPFFGTADIAD